MYGKVFRQIFTGSLYGKFEATVTLQAAIVLSDKEGYLHYTAAALAGATGYPMDVVTKGLHDLMQPDPSSRSTEHEGRRIVPLDDTGNGFQVVNKAKYAAMRDADEMREQAKERQRRHRAKGKDVTPRHAPSPHIDRDVHVHGDKDLRDTAHKAGPAYTPEFEAVWVAFPKRAGGSSKGKAFKAWRARLAEGHAPQTIMAGVERYAAFCKTAGKLETEFVKQASTFLGADCKGFLEPWDAPAGKGAASASGSLGAGSRNYAGDTGGMKVAH